MHPRNDEDIDKWIYVTKVIQYAMCRTSNSDNASIVFYC